MLRFHGSRPLLNEERKREVLSRIFHEYIKDWFIIYAVIDLEPVLYLVRYGNGPWLWFGLTNTEYSTCIGCRKRLKKASMDMTGRYNND